MNSLWRPLAIVGLVTSVALGVVLLNSRSSAPTTGSLVSVYFREDWVGFQSERVMTGTLLSIDDEWLHLARSKTQRVTNGHITGGQFRSDEWIPRAAISRLVVVSEPM